MACVVRVDAANVTVRLSGWDRLMTWRRRVDFAPPTIRAVAVGERSSLEAVIDHRAIGFGTHDGSKRPGRHRVGTMLGRGVSGKQFWAVPPGSGSERLLVLELSGHEFGRAVLHVDDPDGVRAALDEALDLH